MDGRTAKEMGITQILVLSTAPMLEGTLLNQIPHPGDRQEAKIWAEQYRAACLDKGMDTDFEFRFIAD